MASERYPRIWDKATGRHVRLHRVVPAEQLGRPLQPGEVVHHRNGNREDFSAENLRVFPSQAHHMAVEHIERKRAKGQEPLFKPDDLLDT